MHIYSCVLLLGQPSPYIFMQPAGVNRIYVGQRQQLICSISVPPDVDPDTIELGWLNEEDIVTDDSRVTINDSSTGPSNDSSNFTVSVVTTVIQFDPLFEDDEGNYSCYAIVNGTQTFTSMQLQVTSKDSIKILKFNMQTLVSCD